MKIKTKTKTKNLVVGAGFSGVTIARLLAENDEVYREGVCL